MGREATPSDLAIRPRDLRFGRGARTDRWWNGGDPVARIRSWRRKSSRSPRRK
jgi:predicted metal-dependent hydrolase